MIFDQENMFLDAASSVTTSDVIANVGGGDAADPLFLVIFASDDQTGTLTFELKTDDDEAFSSPTVMSTITASTATKGIIGAVKVPYGAKKFFRLDCTVSGSLVGTITAGLTETVPNWKFE